MTRDSIKPIVMALCMALLIRLAYGGQEFTLPHLVRLAAENNLLLEISHLERRIAAEAYLGARLLPNPELEYSQGTGEVPGMPGQRRLWSLGLKLSIPNPLYRHYLLKAEKGKVTAEEIKAEISRRDIVKRLKHHYYRLQFNRKIGEFAAERRDILDEIKRITRARASIGEAREIDVLRAAVERQKAGSELFSIEQSISVERAHLDELLNFSLPPDFKIVADFTFAPLPDIESRVGLLIEDSPSLRLRQNRLLVTRNNLKASRNALIDSLQIFGEREREVDAYVWRVGLGLSLPIFNTRSHAIRQAQLEREKAEVEWRHVRNHLAAQIRRLIAQIRVLEQEIRTYRGVILKEGRENMFLSQRLYRAGEISLMVFLDSQQSFFELQERYYRALTEWKILKAELEAFLGETL
jgi:outer membrane protein TolC